MRCPVCHKEFDPPKTIAMPFCGERCRTVDLGRWLGETYSLPAIVDPEADEPVPHVGEEAATGNPAEPDL